MNSLLLFLMDNLWLRLKMWINTVVNQDNFNGKRQWNLVGLISPIAHSHIVGTHYQSYERLKIMLHI